MKRYSRAMITPKSVAVWIRLFRISRNFCDLNTLIWILKSIFRRITFNTCCIRLSLLTYSNKLFTCIEMVGNCRTRNLFQNVNRLRTIVEYERKSIAHQDQGLNKLSVMRILGPIAFKTNKYNVYGKAPIPIIFT